MLWGCFAPNVVGEMEIIEEKMNALKYKNILSRKPSNECDNIET